MRPAIDARLIKVAGATIDLGNISQRSFTQKALSTKSATMHSSKSSQTSSATQTTIISASYGNASGQPTGSAVGNDAGSAAPQLHAADAGQRARSTPGRSHSPALPPLAQEQLLIALRGQAAAIEPPLAGRLDAIVAVFATFKDSEKKLEDMARHYPNHEGLAQCMSSFGRLVKSLGAALASPPIPGGINPTTLGNQQIQVICQGLAACLPSTGPMLFFNSKPLRVALQKLTDSLISRAIQCGFPNTLQSNGEVLDVLSWLSRALKAELLEPSEPIKRCYEKSLVLMHEWTGGNQCHQLLTDHNLGRCAVQLSTIISVSGVDLFTAVHAGPAQSSQPSSQRTHGQVLQTNGVLLQQCILQISSPEVLGRIAKFPADTIALLNVGNLVQYAIKKRVLVVDDPLVTPTIAALINVIGTLSATDLVGSRTDCRPLSNFANLLRTLIDEEEKHTLLFQTSLPMLNAVCARLIDCINGVEFWNSSVASQPLSNLISFVKVCDRMLQRRAAAGVPTTTAAMGVTVSSAAIPLTQNALIDASQCLVEGVGWYGARCYNTSAALGGLLAGLAYLWRRNLVPASAAMNELLQSLLDQISRSSAEMWTDKSRRVVLPVLQALLEQGMTTPEKALRALTQLIPALGNSPSQQVLAILGNEVARLDASREVIVALPRAQAVPLATNAFPISARGLSNAPPGWTRILEPSAVDPAAARQVGSGKTPVHRASTTTTSAPAWRSVGKKNGTGSQPVANENGAMAEWDQGDESAGYAPVSGSYDTALPSRFTGNENQHLPDDGEAPEEPTTTNHAAGKSGRNGTKTANAFQQKAASPVSASLPIADADPAPVAFILAGNAAGITAYFRKKFAMPLKGENSGARFRAHVTFVLRAVMPKLDSVDTRILEALDAFFIWIKSADAEFATKLLQEYFFLYEPKFAGLHALLASHGVCSIKVVATTAAKPKKSLTKHQAATRGHASRKSTVQSRSITIHMPQDGALFLAAQNNQSDAVRQLLRPGRPAISAGAEAIALMNAALHGSTNVIRLLLDSGPIDTLVTTTSDQGMNALMLATMQNRVESMKELLAAGAVAAQVGQRFDKGHSALMIAIQKQHVEATQILLSFDTDGQQTLAKTDAGSNAMMLAAGRNSTTLMRMLLRCPSAQEQLAARDFGGRNALMYAIFGKHEDAVQLLLSTKGTRSQANTCHSDQLNALSLAAMHGFDKGVRLLLATDFADELASPSTSIGLNPLMCAVQKGHLDIVRMLLESKTAPLQCESVTMGGTNALMFAAAAGNVAIVNELLQAANARRQANMVDSNGRSAIAAARAMDFSAVVKLLEPYSTE